MQRWKNIHVKWDSLPTSCLINSHNNVKQRNCPNIITNSPSFLEQPLLAPYTTPSLRKERFKEEISKIPIKMQMIVIVLVRKKGNNHILSLNTTFS